MLRQTGKELSYIKCVSAKALVENIRLENCTEYAPPDDGPPVMKQILDKMSNLVLNNQEDFCNKMDGKLKLAMIGHGRHKQQLL